MKFTLLIQQTPLVESGNYLLIANQLLKLGHQVSLGFVDHLHMRGTQIRAMGYQLVKALSEGMPFSRLEMRPLILDEQDLLWLLALGIRSSFLDKVQMLNTVRAPLVNSLEAVLFLKGKYQLNHLPEHLNHPETHASCDWKWLYRIVNAEGGEWIVKPPAGSHGRDVFKISRNEPNSKAILQSLTGPNGDQYCLIQKYLPGIEAGEKRVLFASGRVIGQYLRLSNDDHRTNIHQGGNISPCNLTTDEMALCTKVGDYLMGMGARFVGMDLVYPHIIEFNVINPGGLMTLRKLSGEDRSGELISAILESLQL